MSRVVVGGRWGIYMHPLIWVAYIFRLSYFTRSKHGSLNPHEDPSHIYRTRPKPMDCGQPLLKKQ